MIKTAFTFFLLLAIWSQTALAQYGPIDHWETVIFTSEPWQYHLGQTAPDPNWKSPAFNASSWSVANGGFGYGNGNETTTIPAVTSLYLRKEFTVSDTTQIVAGLLQADYDDGFVAYLNGVEIARENLGTEGVEPKHTEFAQFDINARLYRDLPYDEFLILERDIQALLVPGKNVLCLQVHNSFTTSPDFAAFFNFHLSIGDNRNYFSPTPPWFIPPPVFAQTTKLPIIRLTIPSLNDSVMRAGVMQVVYRDNETNYSYNELPSSTISIGIRFRGNSTLEFPKKSFRIETRFPNGENNNINLLGLPFENDWALYAPYSDKSLIRNYMAYKMAAAMGVYAPRTRFCEVFRNGRYDGIYMLTETIKRDNQRVDLRRMSGTDTVGLGITGGFILKRDWGPDTNRNAFKTRLDSVPSGYVNLPYEYHYPDADSVNDQQAVYIRNWVSSFEKTLVAPYFKQPNIGYHQYIDVPSFINFLLARELGKDPDSYRYSTYFYKQNDVDGGRLGMGPVWDFNLGFGNVDFSTVGGEQPEGFYYNERGSRMFWFNRLMEDEAFASKVKCRWEFLRNEVLTDAQINQRIDEVYQLLDASADRNHYKWKTIGRYVWPNSFVGETYEEEVEFVREWLLERLAWMDENLPGDCSVPLSIIETNLKPNSIKIWPNPNTGTVNFSIAAEGLVKIELYNIQGQKIFEEHHSGPSGYLELNELARGIYILEATSNQGKWQVKLIKE